MIISVNWLKQYADIDLDITELTSKIGARLVEIEEVRELADKYKMVTIAKVVECVDHPDSDHMHVCRIDDGGINEAPRDDDGYVQVVCGASNIRAGLTVAWLPPSSIVPESYGTKDEFKLSARKLRGILSQGMIASPRELDLWDEHEGILEIDDTDARPGDRLIDVLGLDDCLIEVENKSLTHRPDCFGVIGFAREVAAILGQSAKIPNWFNNLDGQLVVDKELVQPTVAINDPKLCTRYECVALGNIDSNRSLPVVRQSMLGRLGIRPISAVVDITNYLMLETGQPLHAFDLDKVIELSPTGKPDIIVRSAKKGETLELLDGRTAELDQADIIIAVGDQANSVPVALAGAMGGATTGITNQTKNILLESATFDLYRLRGTQFRHGIFSEAITRFTKGQPADLTHPVLLRAVDMMKQYVGAEATSQIVEEYPDSNVPISFTIPTSRFTEVLGEYRRGGYTGELISRTLVNLQYGDVRVDGDAVKATAPWWRTDLRIDEDVIEDIGRVNGYDNIVGTSPQRQYSAAPYDELWHKQMSLRNHLKEAGGNEVITYSFIHGDLLDKVGDDKSLAYRIVNAISPNLQYYRRDLLPGLVELTRDNLRAGYDNFMLFELGKVHRRGLMDEDEITLPAELPQVSGVMVRKNRTGDVYYDVKQVVEYVLGGLNSFTLTRLDQYSGQLDSSTRLFEPLRSAVIELDGQFVGVVGEFTTGLRRNTKLPEGVAGFSLLIEPLLGYLGNDINYTPVQRYQGTSRDITYQVNNDQTYQQVLDFTERVLSSKMSANIVTVVTPKDIYQVDEKVKNITLHIDFSDSNQTINTKLVNKAMERLAKQAEYELPAKVV